MDMLGPLTPSTEGYNYILVCTEWMSRWVEAIPLHNQEAATIAKALHKEIFCRYGAPRTLLSDRGRNLMSKIIKYMNYKIMKYITSKECLQVHIMLK